MWRYIPCLLSLLCSAVVLAEPVVIFDSGNTVPIYPYKEVLFGAEIPDFGEEWALEKQVEREDQEQDPTDPENWLPLVTEKLSPGKVVAREVQYNALVSAVCVIGSDRTSIDWIYRYQKALLDNDVFCWLVQAQDVEDVRRVVEALDGISVSPADGDALADFFQIEHYPVLITHRFIEQ